MDFKCGIILLIAAYISTASARSPCACARNLKPVCGSDGNTYSNECMLECARANGNSELTLVQQDSCAAAATPICVCPLIYAPVCGSDGKTYPDECTKRCQNSDVTISYRGECKSEEVKVVDAPTCTCTRDAKQVCGSNGVTYPNVCLLNCATQTNNDLTLEHDGPCEDKVKVVEQPRPDTNCVCTRNLKPVCGTDGVTYGNECVLRCAGATVSRQGPCDV